MKTGLIKKLVKKSDIARVSARTIFNFLITCKQLQLRFSSYTRHELGEEKFIIRKGTDDKKIINEVYNGNYKLKIPNDSVIIDIGAHIGAYSILASKYAKVVYAFEPYSESYSLLTNNIEMNQIGNVKTYCKGIAKKKGKKKLYLSPNSVGAYSIYSLINQKSCKIECITLGDFIISNKIEKVDILKLDVEGAEYEILFNLPKEILSKIKNITMECHSMELINIKYNLESMKKFLENNGFKVSSKLNDLNNHYYVYATEKNNQGGTR